MEDSKLLFLEFLNASSEIKKSVLFTEFLDAEKEEKFLNFQEQNWKILNGIYLIFHVVIYILAIVLGSYFISSAWFYIINGFGILIALVLTILFCLLERPSKLFIDLGAEFLLFGILIGDTFFLSENNFQSNDLVKIIHLIIVTKNISTFISPKLNVIILLIFWTLNIIYLLIFMLCYSKPQVRLIEEVVFDFILTAFLYEIRRIYENLLRKTFIQTMKFKNYFENNKDLINCMSGLHITFSKENLCYLNNNTNNLIENISKNEQNNRSNLFFNFSEIKVSQSFENKHKNFRSTTFDDLYFSLMQNGSVTDFINSNQKEKNSILEKKKEFLFLFFSKIKIISTGEKYDLMNILEVQNREDGSQENHISLSNNNNLSKSLMNIREMSEINQNNNIHSYSQINNNNGNFTLGDIINKLLKENKNDCKLDKFELLGEFAYWQNNGLEEFNKLNIQNRNNILKKRNSVINNENQNNNNNSVENEQNLKKPVYFLVYYRIVNEVVDFILHDVTLIRNSEEEALENKAREKILGNVAHEFKTPLNSIISQITNIKDKYLDMKNEIQFVNKESENMFREDLQFIEYLSNYTNFLISDLMQFIKKEKIMNIQISVGKVILKNIVTFGFEIMKTLIS